MKIKTTRFGEVEVIDDLVFSFESPIIGFNDLKKYMLIEHDENSCFKWLQSLDREDIAFAVTSPVYFGIDYKFEIPDEEAAKINLKSSEELIVLNIASIPSNPKNTTLNLKAPIIVNMTNLKSMQIILPDEKLAIKHKIFNEAQSAPEQKKEKED